MVNKANSVFISYRRKTSKHPALLVFKDLTQHGYDVFIDYESINSGKFAEQILNQIASRGHFVVILSPGCLDRTVQPGDWLRREIEYAMDMQRNVVPLLFDNFDFGSAQPYLTGKLAALDDFNGLPVPDGYFDEAMTKLRNRFLKQPTKGVVEPVVRTDTTFVLGTLQKASDAAQGKEGQLAARKYLAGLQVSPIKWLPASKLLKDRIVDLIHEKVFKGSNGIWDIGIFRISYSTPVQAILKKKQPKWERDITEITDYYLSSLLIDTDLLSRYDSKTYMDNKEDFDRHTFKLPYPEEDPSSPANLRIPSLEESRMELLFRMRLNLVLNMSSRTEFTKTDIEKFANQLIDIHEAHHIPIGEIKIRVVK